jgi:carbonic anhydrase
VRLLTKGGADPMATDAFKKALDTADWGTRKAVICAAQNALASSGQKVEVLSSCQNLQAQSQLQAPAEKVAASEPKAPEGDSGKGAMPQAAPPKPAEPAKTSAEQRLLEAARKNDPKAAAAAMPPWSYEGDLGPDNWGERYAMCGRGRNQSPINLAGPVLRVKYELIHDYKPGPLVMVNDGRTWHVNVAPGSKMRIDSLPYDLLSMTFQRPSGEQIHGKSFPMGIHLLHRDLTGKLVTVVVLIREGNENPGIKLLWGHGPTQAGQEAKPDGVNFNPANLLPRELKFFTYDGSLTTPPCSENMRYYILREPINASREQILQFPFKISSRPVQPQNGRPISTN